MDANLPLSSITQLFTVPIIENTHYDEQTEWERIDGDGNAYDDMSYYRPHYQIGDIRDLREPLYQEADDNNNTDEDFWMTDAGYDVLHEQTRTRMNIENIFPIQSLQQHLLQPSAHSTSSSSTTIPTRTLQRHPRQPSTIYCTHH